MKTIYLVRHSKPFNNNYLLFQDIVNSQSKNKLIPLSMEGEKLAYEMTLKYFKSNINYLWSSTYERAISTAKYIAEANEININITSMFDERKMGDDRNISEDFWLTQLNDENAKAQGGESQKEVRERMLIGLNNILYNVEDDTRTVIVTHATAITFLLMNWCQLESATLKGKKRWLTFNEKDVINDSFHTPEIFKLEFNENILINVIRLD